MSAYTCRMTTKSASHSAAAISSQLKAIFAELDALRAIKVEHEALLHTLAATGLGTAPLRRSNGSAGRAAVPAKGMRIRSTQAQLAEQYTALCKHCPSDWQTREAICGKAGLAAGRCKRAFDMCVKGFKAKDGKNVKPVLHANGKVGLKGAYRAAR